VSEVLSIEFLKISPTQLTGQKVGIMLEELGVSYDAHGELQRYFVGFVPLIRFSW
jgi:hypothetical protein